MTVPVSVIVPWRGDDGGPRDLAWSYVRAWWHREHPDWQVVEAECPPGPWSKGAAVAAVLVHRWAWAETLIIADADVIVGDVGQAVAAVNGSYPWAVPHYRVYRLTEEATGRVLAGGPLPAAAGRGSADVAAVYTGVAGGGMVVLPAALYARVPLDPRFLNWSCEDLSWAHALSVVGGRPFRGSSPLHHLWHPPQPRISRRVGSLESKALYSRYLAAQTSAQVTALLAEIHTSAPVE